ncbi:unnamed protein product [Amoebophrya sp. A120]|nr:unnamed protein product [Amoebophrya sp. A120]|eukprot:GSA120T00003358001.1
MRHFLSFALGTTCAAASSAEIVTADAADLLEEKLARQSLLEPRQAELEQASSSLLQMQTTADAEQSPQTGGQLDQMIDQFADTYASQFMAEWRRGCLSADGLDATNCMADLDAITAFMLQKIAEVPPAGVTVNAAVSR